MIPLFKIYTTRKDINAVNSIIRRGTYWADGPEIKEFENKLKKHLHTKYVLTFNSGTNALYTLLLAHELKGKEIIIPSFSFIATANTVLLAKGIPVFAETENETFGLDYEDAKQKINKNTGALMTLHYGGIPAKNTEKLRNLCKKKNILFIEEAAEAFGSKINNSYVGTIGDSAIFSTCQNKVLTTGEGGFIVTKSKTVYEKAKLLRSHGRVELSKDYFSSIKDNDYVKAGFNFRIPTMLAALGISQLSNIEKIITLRRKVAHKYNKAFKSIKEINTLKEIPKHFQVYQMYSIQLPNKKIRDELQKELTKNGIASKVYFNPIHLKTIYTKNFGYKKGSLPKTETISDTVLNIPMYPKMKRTEQKLIINSIKKFFKR